jgi:hypothetical protein
LILREAIKGSKGFKEHCVGDLDRRMQTKHQVVSSEKIASIHNGGLTLSLHAVSVLCWNGARAIAARASRYPSNGAVRIT